MYAYISRKCNRITVSEVVRCTTAAAAAVNTCCPVDYPVCSDFVSLVCDCLMWGEWILMC